MFSPLTPCYWHFSPLTPCYWHFSPLTPCYCLFSPLTTCYWHFSPLTLFPIRTTFWAYRIYFLFWNPEVWTDILFWYIR
jgi:hypothetical protein